MISSPEKIPEINLFDECHDIFVRCGLGDMFSRYFDYWISSPASDRCYLYKGPDWMAWFRHIDPVSSPDEYVDFPETLPAGDAWLIFYLASRNRSVPALYNMAKLLPYTLPYVAYGRAVKKRIGLKFIPMESILRK
jgi:hypothetical protein